MKEADRGGNLLNSPILFIEPTNKCNLRCAACPSNREMERKKGWLDPNIFQNLIDEVEGESPFLNFWGWGESILHPEIFGMIRYAADHNVKVRMSSNIEPLKDRNIEQLVRSGLHMLLVPIDGFSQEAHSAYRIGGNVDIVKDKIHKISEMKRNLSKSLPYLVILTLATKQAISEMDEIIRFAHEANVDALMIKYPNLWRSKKNDDEVSRLYDQFISEDPQFSRYRLVDGGIELAGKDGPCPFLDKNGTILLNGDVTTCCYDHDGRYKVGNITDEGGYRGVLDSDNRKNMWTLMERKALDICKFCDASGPRTQIVIYNDQLQQSDFDHL